MKPCELPVAPRYTGDGQAERLPAILADLAVRALIDEASLTPKPGLVDRHSNGAHTDLSWSLMCASARTLRDYFADMARVSLGARADTTLRATLGHIGREAEAAMLETTAGVNTHRGAIWALGLLVSAVAIRPDARCHLSIASRAGMLARIPDPHAPRRTGSKGEQVCLRLGVGGARGQAAAGFPHVVTLAMPMLQRVRSIGCPEDIARIDTLLALMSQLDDTCVLARGGWPALRALQQGALDVLRWGGASTSCGRARLQALERDLLIRHISPGGSADLLAATLLLDGLDDALTGIDKEQTWKY